MQLDALQDRRIVVLPDLYVDALAFLPPWTQARRKLGDIAARGGGNLPVGPIEFKLGGNAANLALALGRLGAEVDLIAETGELGRMLLDRAVAGTRVRTDRVRMGATAATIGLECGTGAERANVMLSHAGPVLAFGPDRLEAEDWRRIESADAVAIVNWSQNQQGTELLAAVAARARGFVYLDTGDVRHRLADARSLLGAAIWPRIGALGLNENELAALAGEGDPAIVARGLAQQLGVRIDLHTRHWAASIGSGPQAAERVPSSAAPGRRVTGAGDAWNAGNLAGQLLGMPARERLQLAHAVATAYVTSHDGLPPQPSALLTALTSLAPILPTTPGAP